MKWTVLWFGVLCSGCADSVSWAPNQDEIAYANFFRIPASVALPICTPGGESQHSLLLPIDGTPCSRLSEDADFIIVTGDPYSPDDYDTLEEFVDYRRALDAKFGRPPPIWKTEATQYERLFADELETTIVVDHFVNGRYRATAYALLSLNGKWGPYLSSEYAATMHSQERDSARANTLFMKVLRAIDLKNAK